MFPKYFLLFVVLFSATIAKAQPQLPDMIGATDKAINVLSWFNQYDGVKSIAIQRSRDSVFNYATIGYIKNNKKGSQAYIDGHPAPGNNWYRLYIVFNSDLTWYSNRVNIKVDSLSIANKGIVPPNDSLQKLVSKIRIDTTGVLNDSLQSVVNKLRVVVPTAADISEFTYVRSQYVFTNPFTGHINMELPDVRENRYSVKFLTTDNKKLFEIPRVTESPLIIDKRNFQRKGVFKFELLKNGASMETGYITIY